MSKVNFEKEVIQASQSKPVLAQFTAAWCGPCKAFNKYMNVISGQRDDFEWVKIDVEKNLEMSAEYRIRAVPTIMMFVDGQRVSDYRYGFSVEKINAWIDMFVAKKLESESN